MLGRTRVLNGARRSASSKPVVHQLEGDAGLDERVVPAERRVLDPLAARSPPWNRAVCSEYTSATRASGRSLRRYRSCSVAPGEDVLDGSEPARVVQRARELGEPGPHAVGDALRDPEADLVSLCTESFQR